MTTDDLMRDYTVKVKRYIPTDPRLGRHVIHDSRARLFAAPEPVDIATLKSVRHQSRIPVLDQGNLGSCTGVSATKCLSYGALWDGTLPASGVPSGTGTSTVQWGRDVLSETDADADMKYGVGVYSEATRIDPWPGAYPPEDTGSNGASVAKILKDRGLISGYTHALSFEAALAALARQALITGTLWLSDMFEPAADGQLHATGNEEGGHEYVLDELDMERKRVWIQNQWGPGWGLDGRAWFSFDDYRMLLEADGDVTIFVANSQPAPVPTPTPTTAYAAFEAAGDRWAYVERHSSASNVRMVKAYKAWKDAGAPGKPPE